MTKKERERLAAEAAARAAADPKRPAEVEVVLVSRLKVGDRWLDRGSIVAMAPAEAADLKAVRFARDVKPTDGGRRYARRDMQAEA
jgi:hypothetical protein